MPLSHLDSQGRLRMVDVGAKPPVARRAVASGRITMQPQTVRLIRDGQIIKGDVLAAAEVAGIMAAKKCADLIPLCHPLLIDQIEVRAALLPAGVEVRAQVRCTGATGVEMEALTAVSVALLTLYDMCKAADTQMVIEGIALMEKTKQ